MWKYIKGFEGLYSVSDDGRIKSEARFIHDSKGHVYLHKEKILKPNIIKNGYQIVCLRRDSKSYTKYVHHLVAEHFVPNPDNNTIINHKDGNKQNCDYKNLEWVTYSENNQHAYDTGLHGCGEQHYIAKLREEDVVEIRANGKYTTYQNIADKYNVSKATIRDILIGKTWKQVS